MKSRHEVQKNKDLGRWKMRLRESQMMILIPILAFKKLKLVLVADDCCAQKL